MSAPTLPPTAAAQPPGEPDGRRVDRLRGSVGSLMRRVRSARPSTAPPWLLGLIAALWAAAIGLALAALPLLVMWMATPDSGLTWTQALRLSGLLWVVAHGVPITIAGVTFSVLPWGLVLVPLLLLGYGGGWAARRSAAADGRAVGVLVLVGSVAYAAAVAGVAVLTAEPASRTSAVAAAVHGLVIAVVALGWGATRAAGLSPEGRLPAPVSVALRAGLAGAAALVGFGAIAATVSLAAHLDDAITMTQSLSAGLGGGLALALLGMAYAPVLALWGTAYVMGAGVVVGPAITLSPFIATSAPTQLPPFPLLAALPQGASTLAWLLPAFGVLAGVVAGVLIARRARREPRLVRLAMAAGAAAVAGLVLAVGAALSTGALGDVRLAMLGPSPATVGILGAMLVVLGAVPSALVPSSPDRPRLTVATTDAPLAAIDSAVDAPDPDSDPDPDPADPRPTA